MQQWLTSPSAGGQCISLFLLEVFFLCCVFFWGGVFCYNDWQNRYFNRVYFIEFSCKLHIAILHGDIIPKTVVFTILACSSITHTRLVHVTQCSLHPLNDINRSMYIFPNTSGFHNLQTNPTQQFCHIHKFQWYDMLSGCCKCNTWGLNTCYGPMGRLEEVVKNGMGGCEEMQWWRQNSSREGPDSQQQCPPNPNPIHWPDAFTGQHRLASMMLLAQVQVYPMDPWERVFKNKCSLTPSRSSKAKILPQNIGDIVLVVLQYSQRVDRIMSHTHRFKLHFDIQTS